MPFPKIQSSGIRVVSQNQRIIRCDVCDHPPDQRAQIRGRSSAGLQESQISNASSRLGFAVGTAAFLRAIARTQLQAEAEMASNAFPNDILPSIISSRMRKISPGESSPDTDSSALIPNLTSKKLNSETMCSLSSACAQ